MACLLFTAEISAKAHAWFAYRGSGPALNDLVGGHVDFMCEQSVSVAESVLAGSVKAYAVFRQRAAGDIAECADREGGRHQL